MKIIKRGQLPEEATWVGTCHNCKSVIEAKEGELKVTYCQKEGAMGSGACPFCTKSMHFNKDKH